MKERLEEEPPQRWNKQDKKKPWLFYMLIATICFAIAWTMS